MQEREVEKSQLKMSPYNFLRVSSLYLNYSGFEGISYRSTGIIILQNLESGAPSLSISEAIFDSTPR